HRARTLKEKPLSGGTRSHTKTTHACWNLKTSFTRNALNRKKKQQASAQPPNWRSAKKWKVQMKTLIAKIRGLDRKSAPSTPAPIPVAKPRRDFGQLHREAVGGKNRRWVSLELPVWYTPEERQQFEAQKQAFAERARFAGRPGDDAYHAKQAQQQLAF